MVPIFKRERMIDAVYDEAEAWRAGRRPKAHQWPEPVTEPQGVKASNDVPGKEETAGNADEATSGTAPQGRGIAPRIEPASGSPEFGTIVVLASGSRIPDDSSPTDFVMAPVDNLDGVAAAGRRAGESYRALPNQPATAAQAAPFLVGVLGGSLGHGGTFDYQRKGNSIAGVTQLRHFRNISNVNVGLFGQQAGLTLDEVLTIAGDFAGVFSRNAKPDEPYGLDPKTRGFTEVGYRLGESGLFGSAAGGRLPP